MAKQPKDKAPWVTRKEFIARLEADRQRAQTPVRSAKCSRSPSNRRARSPAKRSKKRSARRPPRKQSPKRETMKRQRERT